MKLVLIVDVEDVDPKDIDPHDIAKDIVDNYRPYGVQWGSVTFGAAEWIDHSNPAFQVVMREEGIIR